jgi:hypothetical protein
MSFSSKTIFNSSSFLCRMSQMSFTSKTIFDGSAYLCSRFQMSFTSKAIFNWGAYLCRISRMSVTSKTGFNSNPYLECLKWVLPQKRGSRSGDFGSCRGRSSRSGIRHKLGILVRRIHFEDFNLKIYFFV